MRREKFIDLIGLHFYPRQFMFQTDCQSLYIAVSYELVLASMLLCWNVFIILDSDISPLMYGSSIHFSLFLGSKFMGHHNMHDFMFQMGSGRMQKIG